MSEVEPLVSVVLPAYNVREHIAEAIRSVQAQGFNDMEIIVVDDGSADGTADFVATQFPEVKLFRKANGGAATARNLGVRESRGRFVAFLDADDVWLPGKLKAQIDYMALNPHVRLVCGGFSFWLADECGQFPDPSECYPAVAGAIAEPENSGWVYHKLLLSNFVWTSTVVMSKSLIDEIGLFDENLRLGQDYDYWLRASRVTEIHRLGGTTALYRKHAASATARGNLPENHAARILHSAVAKWGKTSPNGESITDQAFSERLYNVHFSSAHSFYHRCLWGRARVEFLNCVKTKPTCLKSWAYLGLASMSEARSRLKRGG